MSELYVEWVNIHCAYVRANQIRDWLNQQDPRRQEFDAFFTPDGITLRFTSPELYALTALVWAQANTTS